MFSFEGGFKELSVFLNSEKEIPIYNVDTKEKKIAITYDVADGNEYVDKILQVLDKNKINATFFVLGCWVDKFPGSLKTIYDKGNEIGNHSNLHPHMTRLSNEDIKLEVYKTNEKIKSITGDTPVLFRAPYGEYNNSVVKTVTGMGNYFIQWDVDSIDWKDPGEDYIYKKVVSKVSNGSIILFHSNSEESLNVLDKIIKTLKSKGYSFVKVSDLIYKDNYYIDNTGKQKLLTQAD